MPAGADGQLSDLGKKLDIAFGINSYHGISLADILLDDVLHYSRLANTGSAKTPEVSFAITVWKTQLDNSLRLIKMNTSADMRP
jgi:hypothetical protein